MEDEKPPSPGYLWRPGASPEHRPLLVVVAVVITVVLVGSIVLALTSS